MTEMPPEQAFATAISIALRILGNRTLAFLSLGMAFSLFCWAMWAHSWIAFTTAGTFSLMTYLPALWSGRARGNDA